MMTANLSAPITHTATTSQTGTPVASDEHSLTVGADGVAALHDRYLVEKLAQFNRERIPERIVHAKGGGAFGTFTVTGDVSRYTRVAAFQPGAQVGTAIRFSSVAGEQGSPDTWRDVRGFATRFYTPEGNLDGHGLGILIPVRRQAGCVPDGAFHVFHAAAADADGVVVVVAYAGLIQGGGVRRLEPAQHVQVREVAQDHVNGLRSEFRELGPGGSEDALRR
jgi:hypothetical protein